MKTEVIHSGNENAKRRAVEVLKAGGLVAFPTDTVYGLGVLPWNLDAVARLYEVKARPLDMAIPLLLSDASQLNRVATLPSGFKHELKQLIKRFWPGGLTLVLPKVAIVPDAVSRGSTVAVRVPDLELARHVIQDAGGVLATTSANISGQPSPVTAQEVENQLGDRIDLILDGGLSRGGIPSSILDCAVLPPVLLRHGPISVTNLRSVVGPIKIPNQGET
jgi:L-threonylcarbamoyladenylate synthase